ncbi:MAG: DUF402 domain-containing protein [Mycoplasmataceae bacterium]|nr:DUF402 domain-containing protein [Mycoplasmataceae bacterium]
MDKKLIVHAYKFDGKLYRTWEFPNVIEENDKYICVNLLNTRVITADDATTNRFFHSKLKRPTIWYFFKDEWYNMIVSKKSNKYYYYINIASPYIVEDEIIKYIDFDLDYRIPDAHSSKINLLDVNEFNEHKVKYQYPEKLIKKIELVKQEVLNKFNQHAFDQYLNYDLIYRQNNKGKNERTK